MLTFHLRTAGYPYDTRGGADTLVILTENPLQHFHSQWCCCSSKQPSLPILKHRLPLAVVVQFSSILTALFCIPKGQSSVYKQANQTATELSKKFRRCTGCHESAVDQTKSYPRAYQEPGSQFIPWCRVLQSSKGREKVDTLSELHYLIWSICLVGWIL